MLALRPEGPAVADQLIEAGIRAFLNYAPITSPRPKMCGAVHRPGHPLYSA